MEFVGEILNHKEYRSRVKQYAKEKNVHSYFMALKPDEILDATYKGNHSRFINHSCNPNCETQKVNTNFLLSTLSLSIELYYWFIYEGGYYYLNTVNPFVKAELFGDIMYSIFNILLLFLKTKMFLNDKIFWLNVAEFFITIADRNKQGFCVYYMS